MGSSVLDTIDATLQQLCACGCGSRLDPAGPSGWFVNEGHQLVWHAAQLELQAEKRYEAFEAIRRRVCLWLVANGLDPMRVVQGYPIITTPTAINVHEFVYDGAGDVIIEPGGDEPMTVQHTAPLVEPWPAGLDYEYHYHYDCQADWDE